MHDLELPPALHHVTARAESVPGSERLESPPDFSLRFDGILPLGKDKKRLKRNVRERVLRGMLRSLRAGEALTFRYAHTAEGGLDWHISGHAGPDAGGARDLGAMVNTALGGLRQAYRFSPTAAGVDHKHAWIAEVAPVSKALTVTAGGLGFGAVAMEQAETPIVLPHPQLGKGGRMFESLVQLVLSSPMPVELAVRCEAVQLNEEQRLRLATALDGLNRSTVPAAFKEEHLATCGLLAAWMRAGHGVRITCSVSADEPLPDSFLELAGADVFGCPACRVSHPPPAEALDLSGCLPFDLDLPALLPSAEGVEEARPSRVFNVRLPRIPQNGPHLGTASSGTHISRVALPEEGRSRHTYVVGATGTGKSTLLGNILTADIAAGHGVALIDPHGDLFEHVLATLPAQRAQDVVLFEPAGTDAIPGLNFLDIPDGPMRRILVNFVVSEFFGILEQLYDMRECGGPMFETYFRNAMLLLIESRCPDATVLDFARVFEDKSFRDDLIRHCANIQVVRFWKHTADKAGGEAGLHNIAPYVVSKLNQLTQSGPIRTIIGQARTTIDFRKMMDNRGILLVNLSKGLLGEMDTRLLGMLLIGQIFSAAFGRAALPASERIPFHLYVDEFQNFVTDSVAALVAEARKFGLQLTLANQTLAQLSANRGQQNLLESILGNVGNMIFFRLGAPDAERLALFTEPALPRAELQRLPNFHALARLLTAEGPVDPFVFKSNPPVCASPHAAEVLAKVREHQSRWSRPIEQVDREINERLQSENRWAPRGGILELLQCRVAAA